MAATDQGLLEPAALREKHVVLCVDDDPSILDSLRRCLREEPYEVVTAETPERALEIVERGGVSLLLTDQRMPGMCGADQHRQTCKGVAFSRRGSPFRAIKLTANDNFAEEFAIAA